jgi:hypothetical protein
MDEFCVTLASKANAAVGDALAAGDDWPGKLSPRVRLGVAGPDTTRGETPSGAFEFDNFNVKRGGGGAPSKFPETSGAVSGTFNMSCEAAAVLDATLLDAALLDEANAGANDLGAVSAAHALATSSAVISTPVER